MTLLEGCRSVRPPGVVVMTTNASRRCRCHRRVEALDRMMRQLGLFEKDNKRQAPVAAVASWPTSGGPFSFHFSYLRASDDIDGIERLLRAHMPRPLLGSDQVQRRFPCQSTQAV